MIGLSTTAIGARPFKECLEIYYRLQSSLKLEYLELAIGSKAVVTEIPNDLPIVIHNDWVYSSDRVRWQLSLDADENWGYYKDLVRTHNILAFSFHFAERQRMPLERVLTRRQELAEYLERPVSLELMPNSKWWGDANDFETGALEGVPLCVDLSHLNIWAANNATVARDYVQQLESQAVQYHVSINNGREDSHDLIPKGHWVEQEIERLKSPATLITYEALPIAYERYERLDKQRRRNKTAASV